MATAQQDQSESAGDGGYQTAVIAVLAIALLGTATWWIVMHMWRRIKLHYTQVSFVETYQVEQTSSGCIAS